MTEAVSDEYLELVVDIHNRQFQRYSIERSIYHIPVDEVRHELVVDGTLREETARWSTTARKVSH